MKRTLYEFELQIKGMVNDLSAAVLAGGMSSRMGVDKSFLKLNGRPFVQIVAEKLSGISDDVMVIVGKKDVSPFASVLAKSVRVISDYVYTASPIGGLMTSAFNSRHSYFAVVAVDMPLANTEIMEILYNLASGHSAAVPILNGNMEPLFSVYSSDDIKRVNINNIKRAIDLVMVLSDVVYVDAEKFRSVDPKLSSFTNVNTISEYLKLNDNKSEL